MPNTPPLPLENSESLNPTTLPEQASAGLTENVKSDVSQVLNPEAIDEFGLTLAEKAQVDAFVKAGIFTEESFLELPEKLRGKYLVMKLMETGKGYSVARILEKFHGLDHREIALAIIEKRDGDFVARNLEKFQGLDHREIALAIIKTKKFHSVARNLEKFQGLDHKEIALAIIEKGGGEDLQENLKRFQGLDQTVALALIEKEAGRFVADNLEKFQGLDHKEIALAIIEKRRGSPLTLNLNKFQGLDRAVALAFIEKGYGDSLASNLKRFQGLDQTVALALIEKEEGWSVIYNAFRFKGIESIYGTVFTGSKCPTGMTLGDGVSIYNIPQIGNQTLYNIHNLSYKTILDYKKHIKPILDAQSVAAFLYFESIGGIKNSPNFPPSDIDYITLVAKKYGTLALNILENILAKVPDISVEKDIIESYLEYIGIAHIDLYNQYKEIKTNGGNLDTIKENISVIQSKIHEGDMIESDFKNKITPAILYHTFPPAMAITQNQYNHLIQRRPDRRGDVPVSLDPLQYQKFSVGTGHYELGEEEELDLDIWNALGVAVKKVNSEKDDMEKGKTKLDPTEVAEKLINIYQTKGINEGGNRAYLFEAMYRYHLSKEGGKLSDSYELSQAGLMKYKEFIGDTVKNDLLSEVIASWKLTNGDRWEALKKDTQNRFAMDNDKLYMKINGLLQGLKHAKDDAGKQKAGKTLNTFLADYGIAYEQIHDLDDKSLKDFIAGQNLQRDWEDVTIRVISSYLAGTLNSQMRKEVDKFQFSDDQAGEREHELEFVISKKKEHGMIGFNMGVCVAPDEELWDDPTFMNVIIFDPKTKQSQGGVHLLIRENCLCLPGINPSTDLLGTVDNEKLYTAMIDYVQAIATNLGLQKVLIPKEASIYSNRSQIQSIVPSKAYPTHKLEQIAKFSYSPYEYSFQDCWSVNI